MFSHARRPPRVAEVRLPPITWVKKVTHFCKIFIQKGDSILNSVVRNVKTHIIIIFFFENSLLTDKISIFISISESLLTPMTHPLTVSVTLI